MYCQGDISVGSRIEFNSNRDKFSAIVDFTEIDCVYVRISTLTPIGTCKHIPLYPVVDYCDIIWVSYGNEEMREMIRDMSKL